ncbi:MAG: MFS transporter [Bacilli bacterium]|nr:MFS transporter [Bacilli bacterium]
MSSSFVVVSGGAIAVNVPAIARDFPEIPLPLVESLTTMPSLFLIVSVLLSHAIARKVGYKRTVLVGLATVLVSGLVPVFVHHFWIIFLSRALFGFGIGLFNSLLVSFIRHFYEGAERAAMIGLQSAFEGIGGMTISFLVGQLLKIDWQTSFWVYLAALPAMLLFAALVPDIPAEPAAVSSQPQQTDIILQIKTLDPLTVREHEVLQLILSGKSNREIAGDLFISESTVKTHARNIFSKYDVGSRAELISTLLKNQRVE